MHMGLFRVDANTAPFGSEDATPRSCGCVRVRALLGRGGLAGLPGAFWCASPFPLAALSFFFVRPPRCSGCPVYFCLCCFFYFIFACAPLLSLAFHVFQNGCLGPWRLLGPPEPFSFCRHLPHFFFAYP